MPYTRQVNFTSTNNYGNVKDGEDDVYTVEEFQRLCKAGAFIDYDGHGYPVKDAKADTDILVKPSALPLIPQDATHVVWYNR